jgi:hypothetical protein
MTDINMKFVSELENALDATFSVWSDLQNTGDYESEDLDEASRALDTAMRKIAFALYSLDNKHRNYMNIKRIS